MKTFDYVTSRQSEFNIILGQTVGLWQQGQYVDRPPVYVLQNRASIAYCVVQTIDGKGHLVPRDKIVLVGRGTAKLIFPKGTNINWRYWNDIDLAEWYRGDENNWHRVRAVTRRR